MEKKHPNDMTEAEYNEWAKHPELAHWEEKRSVINKLSFSVPLAIGLLFEILGLFGSIAGSSNAGLAFCLFGIFLALYAIFNKL